MITGVQLVIICIIAFLAGAAGAVIAINQEELYGKYRSSDKKAIKDAINKAFSDSEKIEKIEEVMRIWRALPHAELDNKALNQIQEILDER